ncbi:MAG: leucine--tRNA ligase [Pseudomonadota bacterium]
MNEKYFPRDIEPRWQAAWDEACAFRVDDTPVGDRAYVLEMFPYPSGSLHIGNLRCYVIGDVLARFLRMRGKQVMHPMGFDALGLPAENAAIKDGIAPAVRTEQNIDNAKRQMRAMGLSYDWSREISTHRPEYYRWNQWFFLRCLERDLVYRRTASVNWCPRDKTVLANEQVVDGCCERCSTAVVTKDIPVWAFRITRFCDDLLAGLDGLNWPDRIVTSQRNWIGKSHGAEVDFDIEGREDAIRVFTTRIDTIFGATYLVLAPEHPLVSEVTTPAQRSAVDAFVERMRRTDKNDRTDDTAVKEGVFTGAQVRNPFTGELIPLWIANFVLADYGTGAVMSVPAHDQRDFEFARTYKLPIRTVILEQAGARLDPDNMPAATCDDGVMAHPDEMGGPDLPAAARELASACAGQSSTEGRTFLTDHAATQGFGQGTVNFHLRDWNFSRQRYWGTPIPVVYCDDCGTVPVPDDQLPVVLPPFEAIELKMTGTAPLSGVPGFVNTSCPHCGKPARRDVETMDTFVDSAWYFARFLSPHHETAPVATEAAHAWLPIDVYVGGPEHAVGHLIYFRFFHRILKELGLVEGTEPARRLITQGIVYNRARRCKDHGWLFPADIDADDCCKTCHQPAQVTTEKMSKSKGNAVSPDLLIENYGADCARVFMLFAGPPQKDLEWNDAGVEGASRFLHRVWRLFTAARDRVVGVAPASSMSGLEGADATARKALHRTLDKVTHDIEGPLHYNTAIAAVMELVNTLYGLDMHTAASQLSAPVEREALEVLTRLLSPFAPHLAEELHAAIGGQGMAALASWPDADPDALVLDQVTYAVQVNGKLRGDVQVDAEADQAQVESVARGVDKVRAHLEGKSVVKVVFVKGRLLNFVVR